MEIAEHQDEMPYWLDAMVSRSEQRKALIEFYSELFGWSFEVGGSESGYYSIAKLSGKQILAIGENEFGQKRWDSNSSADGSNGIWIIN